MPASGPINKEPKVGVWQFMALCTTSNALQVPFDGLQNPGTGTGELESIAAKTSKRPWSDPLLLPARSCLAVFWRPVLRVPSVNPQYPE